MNYYSILTANSLQIGDAMWVEVVYPMVVVVGAGIAMVLVLLGWFLYQHRIGNILMGVVGWFDAVTDQMVFWVLDRMSE